ncbi:right-handed parallel beta-helix repeat-containing protein [Pseudokineococcus marinus]|uniref:Right-handed parallel beta-helix repeat-containing protein n=1 Tax=Pseudokineococcus marinus TaxID=351215 RepID=A0A849BK34_9ACTN|nr:right-handed parallel beta-helix repeat-containing protein [Pseudokineococcus marinus]NNH21633.1 right-handed parallel beta-helix repeat-containing protein [Pseudokineococcus marinus]
MALIDREPDFKTFDDAAPATLPSDTAQAARKSGPDLFRLGQALRALARDYDAGKGTTPATTTPRPGLLKVASADLPADVKAGADFVCDGTNDQAEITAALVKASRPADGFGGQGYVGVELVGPNFYVGHDGATSILMHPSTHLRGAGDGTLIQPMYPSAIDRGAIQLVNANVTRSRVSDLTIARANASAFNGHGIKYVGAGTGDTYELKTGNDPFNRISGVNVHKAAGKGIWCTGSSGGSREMQIFECVLFNCFEQGLLVDSSSDSQISDIRATGGSAFPGIELGGGNTRLANSKVYYRGNTDGSTTGADGIKISSSRCEVTGCAAQDCGGYGLNVSSADATVTGFLADSNSAGFRIAGAGVFTGLRATSRAGGRWPQTTGLEFAGTPQVLLSAFVTVPSGGTHVVGAPGANSYARVVRDGTTLFSA